MPRQAHIQTNFTSGELSEKLYGRVDLAKYQAGARIIENMTVAPHGGLYRRPGTRFVAEAKYHSRRCIVRKFVFSATESYVLEIGHHYVRFFTDEAQILVGGVPYEVASAYSEDDVLDIKYVQSADVIYLVHPDHPPRKLSRYGIADWRFSDIDFLWGPFLPENLDDNAKVAPSAVTGSITLTATGCTPFASTDVGRQIALFISGEWGYAKITAFTSTTVVSATVVVDFKATTATAGWRLGAFSGTTGYPAAVCFHEDRLCLAGTRTKPQGLFMSKSSQYENFDDTDPTLDDSAMVLNLVSSDLNQILWLLSSKVMLAGTIAGEWRVGVVSSSSPLTPTTVQAKRETFFGCSKVQAMQISDAVFFVQRSGRKLREFTYTVFSFSEFASKEITVMAEHVFRDSPLAEMDWMREPDGTLWCCRDDGQLVGFTYLKDQEVYAWHRHPMTNGYVESLTCIPESGGDQLWMVVRRDINSGSGHTHGDGHTSARRYIEFMEQASYDLDSAWYVDSGLSYSGPAVTSLGGLDHLEGQAVKVLGNGAVQGEKLVSGGTIELDRACTSVVVGLPIRCVILPMRYELQTGAGTSQGMLKSIQNVTMRLFKSGAGIMIGRDLDNLDVIPVRTASMPMGSPPSIVTGDVPVPFNGGWERDGNLYIVQDAPVPFALVSLVVVGNASDN